MKKVVAILVLALAFAFNSNAQDQAVKTVSLEQTKGEFTQKNLTISEGSYIFEIANNHSGVDVGFVLIQKGKDASNPENHIKTAYVTKVVAEGETEKSNVTTLEKGEYTYFCPLNKTPQYTLTVE
ncbi:MULTISPECIES: cupredoxin domain-containing protein [unclassified Algibacter]|uniref:cupredoxin domain-containing protein n=1 Tax=unclassified Algibacter TaxID=2615009 RepID=UPI00131E7122|nr:MULTISPECIES: cupredoxin domain-containing protein [unclassified Algibacter]MCL5126986.1 cupredoxin domain-containing protein [Algibacter sp. L4_22]